MFCRFPGWAQHSAELTLKDGLQLWREQQYVTLFERANEAVREDPRSVEGQFFLGVALQQGEGNLPLARRSLETAKALLEREKAHGKLTETDSEVYRRTLGTLADIYETTEQYTEELRLIDLARREANLDWSATRGWPLMKLGRMDEARAAMRESLKSTDPVDRRVALNTLGSLEFSTWNYEASYAWFTLLIGAKSAGRPDADDLQQPCRDCAGAGELCGSGIRLQASHGSLPARKLYQPMGRDHAALRANRPIGIRGERYSKDAFMGRCIRSHAGAEPLEPGAVDRRTGTAGRRPRSAGNGYHRLAASAPGPVGKQ